MRLALFSGFLLVGLGLTSLAAADDAPLFSDDFSALRPGWGQPNDVQSVNGNRLLINLPADSSHHILYQGSQFDNVDIRLKVSEVQGGADQPAGIVFWGGEKGDCYVALIQSDGGFYVARRQKGKWMIPVTFKVRQEVQKGVGQVNTLRVVTSGKMATVYVNDLQLTRFQGFPPVGQSKIGVHSESGTDPVMWAFSDLQVNKGPAPPATNAPQDDSLLFADDFQTLEPPWRPNLESQSVTGTAMNISLPAGLNLRDLYWGNLFDDCDISIDVSLVSGGDDQPAGVMFWGTDADNLYSALLCSDGTFYVARRMQGKWLYPVASVLRDEARKGVGQVNTLRVVTSGRWATISINDKQVALFQGYPPTGGSLIGVHAESGTKPFTWSFSKLRVRKAPAPPAESAPRDNALLFADDFRTLDPAWGVASDVLRVEKNNLVINPAANTTYTKLYQGSQFGNIDYRAKIALTTGGVDESAGIVFWAADYDNRYIAEIYSDGTFQISRKMQGQWIYPFGGRILDAVKKGLGQVNELRVVTSGKLATLYVNGQQVAQAKGFPPAGTSLIGLSAESGADRYTWNFSDVSVRQMPATKEPSPQDSTVLLVDDFSALDPAWGESGNMEQVGGNRMMLTPDTKTTYTNLYNGSYFTDIDYRAKISPTKGGGELSGALVFWAADYKNLYTLDLYPDGNVGVSRKADGKWIYPIQGRVRGTVKQGIGEVNELRVVTSGKTATFYVNDQKVNTIQGNPPAGGSRIGLQASSDTDASAWAFWDLSVRQAPDAPPAATVAATPALPDDVIKAWTTAGAQAGWLRTNEFGVPMFIRNGGPEQAGLSGDLPAFNFTTQTLAVKMNELPVPPTPFGLMIFDPFTTSMPFKDFATLKNLQSLTLLCPRLTDLSGLSELTGLRSLRIASTNVTDEGVRQVAGLSDLVGLTLNCNQVTDAGVSQLTTLTGLQALNISGTKASDAILKELAALKNLQALNLASCKVSDGGLQDLAALKGLQTLNIGETPITDSGLGQLRQALPGCGISR